MGNQKSFADLPPSLISNRIPDINSRLRIPVYRYWNATVVMLKYGMRVYLHNLYNLCICIVCCFGQFSNNLIFSNNLHFIADMMCNYLILTPGITVTSWQVCIWAILFWRPRQIDHSIVLSMTNWVIEFEVICFNSTVGDDPSFDKNFALMIHTFYHSCPMFYFIWLCS